MTLTPEVTTRPVFDRHDAVAILAMVSGLACILAGAW
jgi:hypothetical protein